MYNETLADKSGSFFYNISSNITELSEWHINIIQKCFDNSPHKLYSFILNELQDVTPYEATLLLDAVFPCWDEDES